MKAGAEVKPQKYAEGILEGSRSLLAQAITLIESAHPKDRKAADELLALCLPKSGNSIRIGITGAPGVGKSVFIENFGQFLIEEKKRKIAVLAIDPSSTQGKGSILGDKTRMTGLANHPQAFIRPTPSSGSMGGVAFQTRETILLCEAAGYDFILIETLGVGQAQFSVHSMVDLLLLLVLPGSGDSLQGIKRGIMEMIDLILVNKADGTNRKAAQISLFEHQSALALQAKKKNDWEARVLTCSALEKEGLAEAWTCIEEYIEQAQKNNSFSKRRKEQSRACLQEKLEKQMKLIVERIMAEIDKENIDWEKKIFSGQQTAAEFAERLIEEYHNKKAKN